MGHVYIPPTADDLSAQPGRDRKAISDSLIYLDKVAQRTGTVVYLELLNRYQGSYDQHSRCLRRYIVENNLKHVQIIGDFYHMNIEEDDMAQALHDNRDLLGPRPYCG